MLGIKRTTVNQTQLNLMPTHSLASQVVSRGSVSQHRELSQFLSNTAVNQVSATDIMVFSILSVLKAHSGLSSVVDTPMHIQVMAEPDKDGEPNKITNIELQESQFLYKYFSTFSMTLIQLNQKKIQSSTIVYAAYLLEEIEKVLRLAIPCAHCKSIVGDGSCCSLRNNIREFVVALVRLSLSLGNNYEMLETEFFALIKSLGLECRDGYYEEIERIIMKKIDVTFSISQFENYVAARSILIHLGHFPFANRCSQCKLQKRI